VTNLAADAEGKGVTLLAAKKRAVADSFCPHCSKPLEGGSVCPDCRSFRGRPS
jgi:hypothetical protein